jgi:tRNA dimethylallyltransferase
LGRQRVEIVGADSVQVYRRFDIGSGKPTPAERAQVRHHLIDVVDPLEAFDAARWATMAEAAIAEARARGHVTIICGGTFLWVRALLYGLAQAPGSDPEIRRRHELRAESEGRAELHAELSRVDPESAARLSPNDFVRVSRALEVWELTGVPLSRFQAQHGFSKPRHIARLVGIGLPRDEIDERIRERVRAMLVAGWVDEVRQLAAEGYDKARAMGSVGYRQIAETLASHEDAPAAELQERIVRATRVFARRQRTWLRDQPVVWLTREQAERGEL